MDKLVLFTKRPTDKQPDDWDTAIFGEWPSEEIGLTKDAVKDFLSYETPGCFDDPNVQPVK